VINLTHLHVASQLHQRSGKKRICALLVQRHISKDNLLTQKKREKCRLLVVCALVVFAYSVGLSLVTQPSQSLSRLRDGPAPFNAVL
jgi:hypothetical protein